jgi:hypothetical protein
MRTDQAEDWASACAAQIVNLHGEGACERFTRIRDLILSVIRLALTEERERILQPKDN